MKTEAVKAAKTAAPKKVAVKKTVNTGVTNFDPKDPAIQMAKDKKVKVALSFEEFSVAKWDAAGKVDGFFNKPHTTDHHGWTGSPTCPNCDTSLPRFKELYEQAGK